MRQAHTMTTLAAIAVCIGLAAPSLTCAASYSETVLATPGLLAYYPMNEDPAEIGDALTNAASPGTLNGLWGYENNNPDTLPLSGEPGPISADGFGGFGADNHSAFFAGSGADDDGDGDPTNNMADQMDLGSSPDWDNEFATIALFLRAATDGNDSRRLHHRAIGTVHVSVDLRLRL